MSLGIYIKFSSEKKKRQVVGILKKQGIVVSFLQISSRLRYMKRIARKVKVGHTDLLFFNLESCAKLCIHGFSFIYIYIYIYIYIWVCKYIYIYIFTNPSKKITRKKKILATGLPKLGKI